MLICIYSLELYGSLCTGKYRPRPVQKNSRRALYPGYPVRMKLNMADAFDGCDSRAAQQHKHFLHSAPQIKNNEAFENLSCKKVSIWGFSSVLRVEMGCCAAVQRHEKVCTLRFCMKQLKLFSDISNFFIIIVAFFFQTHSVIVI